MKGGKKKAPKKHELQESDGKKRREKRESWEREREGLGGREEFVSAVCWSVRWTRFN